MSTARKKMVAREGVILILVVLLSGICIGQRKFVEDYLSRNRTYFDRARSEEQLYAILGFTRAEIDSITLLNQFRKDYPQFAGLNNWDIIPYFLSENPDFPHHDTLYQNIKSTMEKEKGARVKLENHRILDNRSARIQQFGFIILFAYPFFWLIRFLIWSVKTLKVK